MLTIIILYAVNSCYNSVFLIGWGLIFYESASARHARLYYFYEFKFHSLFFVGCRLQLTSQSGTFSSPYFPDPYPNDIHCKWWITRPNGYVIRLKFLSFELQDSQSCEDEYVAVYDGTSSSSNILGRYCGNSFPLLLESSSNSLLIVFKSDNERSLSGFKMSFTSYSKYYPRNIPFILDNTPIEILILPLFTEKEKEECNFIESK